MLCEVSVLNLPTLGHARWSLIVTLTNLGGQSSMDETRRLLERWRNQLDRRQSAQYLSAEHCRRINNWLGMPVIACTGIVGSTIFATLSDAFGDSIWLTIGLGLMSLTAGVLASLQTFWNYSERAEKHLKANRQFSRLQRDVELLIAPPEPGKAESKITDLKARIDKAIEQSVPPLERVQTRTGSDLKYLTLIEMTLRNRGPDRMALLEAARRNRFEIECVLFDVK